MNDIAAAPEERAQERADEFMGLVTHLGVYLVVNAGLWALDLIQGDGLQWAYWATIGWGIGILVHLAVYAMENGGMRKRRYEKYLAEEIERNHVMHR